MRTLIGVYRAGDQGRYAGDLLRQKGFEVDIIGDSRMAGDVARGKVEHSPDIQKTSAGSGATVAGLATGGIGALPGALIGSVVGGWLNERRAHEYEREIDNGGVLLVVRAQELEPAATAEKILYESGADHVESGETPRP